MKSKIVWPLALLLALSLLPSACGSPSQPVAVPTQPITATESVSETTPTPEPQEASEAELDAAYDSFLAALKEGYNTITLINFQDRLEKEYQPSSADVQTPTNSFILDVRETSEVEVAGHIQGAVNIPLRELGKNLNKLPSFTNPIVVYCSDGFRSTIAMTVLSMLGWSEIYSLGDQGFTGWVEGSNTVTAGLPSNAYALNMAKPEPALIKSIDNALSNLPDGFGSVDTAGLQDKLANVPDLVLIDVRNAEEVEANGSIESGNSPHIPLEDFVANRSEWPVKKDSLVVIYCDTGNRSTIAMQIMESYGYTNVQSLKGGLETWVAAGLPLGK